MEYYDNYTSSERRQLSAYTWQLEYECDWIEPTNSVVFEDYTKELVEMRRKEKHLIPKEWFELE